MEGARRATSDDIAELAALARAAVVELAPLRGGALYTTREARAEPFEASFDADLAADDTIVLLGTFDGHAVGYAAGRREELRSGGRLGVITDLFVLAEAREVGVGEVLMQELLAWFRTSGCAGVDAHALPGTRETKNFFEANGFSARLLVMHHRFDTTR